jgi:hypothetical protein
MINLQLAYSALAAANQLDHRALISGQVRVAMGGQVEGDRRPGESKQADRDALPREIAGIVKTIEAKWRPRMRGVDQHCLRLRRIRRTRPFPARVPGSAPRQLALRLRGIPLRVPPAAVLAVWAQRIIPSFLGNSSMALLLLRLSHLVHARLAG